MRRRAFTLIELLVVISIIAVLMSIMMPALGKVRQQAQATVCMTNIKTITTASMTYTADFDGKYPLSGSRDSADKLPMWGGGYPTSPYWDARLMPYIDSGFSIDPRLNRDIAGSPLASVNPDTFAFLLCPAAKSDPWQRANIKLIESGTSSRAVNKFARGYRLNAMLTGHSKVAGAYSNFNGQAYRDSVKASQVNNSSKTLLSVESAVTDGSCYNSIYGWTARTWADIKPTHFVKRGGVEINNYTWEGDSNDSDERTGQSNLGFADGHVDKIKRVYTNDYWKYGGEADTVGIKFYAVGSGTKAEEGLR
ncbi:MAG: type II secretion system protein [Sedimentisphaeraceae bacterium JB056]